MSHQHSTALTKHKRGKKPDTQERMKKDSRRENQHPQCFKDSAEKSLFSLLKWNSSFSNPSPDKQIFCLFRQLCIMSIPAQLFTYSFQRVFFILFLLFVFFQCFTLKQNIGPYLYLFSSWKIAAQYQSINFNFRLSLSLHCVIFFTFHSFLQQT